MPASSDGSRKPSRSEPVSAIDDGHQPEEHRRLVGVEIAADARNQPVAGAQHVLRDQREARLVGRPRIAQAEAGRHQQQREPDQPEHVEQRRRGTTRARAQQRSSRVGAAAAAPSTQVSSWIRDARRGAADQPHHAEQVDDADPQPVVQAVLGRAARALAVVHRHRHDLVALALEQRRHEAVHVVEARHVA